MSVYTPTVWKNGTTPSISASNLNKLEASVSLAHGELSDIVSGTTVVGRASSAVIAESVQPASRAVVGGIRMWVDNSGTGAIGYIGV